MSSSSLVRWGGIGALGAGLIFIVLLVLTRACLMVHENSQIISAAMTTIAR